MVPELIDRYIQMHAHLPNGVPLELPATSRRGRATVVVAPRRHPRWWRAADPCQPLTPVENKLGGVAP